MVKGEGEGEVDGVGGGEVQWSVVKGERWKVSWKVNGEKWMVDGESWKVNSGKSRPFKVTAILLK